SVLTAQYRYIEPSNGPKMIQWGPKIETGNLPVPQLYDMTVSPFESKNVADEHPNEVSRMQLILKEERNR
ncbi:MAG: arylsulfatase, partial [Prevotella sp.]|nr:arylsulfatase [Prevotella sp.]